jgi:hypothetical protein
MVADLLHKGREPPVEPDKPVCPTAASDQEWDAYLRAVTDWRALPSLVAFDDALRSWCTAANVAYVESPFTETDIPEVRLGVLRNICHWACAISVLLGSLSAIFCSSLESRLA